MGPENVISIIDFLVLPLVIRFGKKCGKKYVLGHQTDHIKPNLPFGGPVMDSPKFYYVSGIFPVGIDTCYATHGFSKFDHFLSIVLPAGFYNFPLWVCPTKTTRSKVFKKFDTFLYHQPYVYKGYIILFGTIKTCLIEITTCLCTKFVSGQLETIQGCPSISQSV